MALMGKRTGVALFAVQINMVGLGGLTSNYTCIKSKHIYNLPISTSEFFANLKFGRFFTSDSVI
jgi:hypothetical protein